MRRSVLILLAMLFGAAAITGSAYLLGRQVCVRQLTASADDLDWLRHAISDMPTTTHWQNRARHALRRRGGRFGLGSACIGGGQGIAVVVESLPA